LLDSLAAARSLAEPANVDDLLPLVPLDGELYFGLEEVLLVPLDGELYFGLEEVPLVPLDGELYFGLEEVPLLYFGLE